MPYKKTNSEGFWGVQEAVATSLVLPPSLHAVSGSWYMMSR